jgi:hypothetical protein
VFGIAILGLILFNQGIVIESVDCEKLTPFGENYPKTYPKLFIKDTSIQVSDDAYIHDQKVIFKTKST